MKILTQVLIGLIVLSCVYCHKQEKQQVHAAKETQSSASFLESTMKGLDFTARTKDQFFSDNCLTQCKGIGGFPCGSVSYSCCLNKEQCKSSWGIKTCEVPIRAFIC